MHRDLSLFQEFLAFVFLDFKTFKIILQKLIKKKKKLLDDRNLENIFNSLIVFLIFAIHLGVFF